jgi:hypothetical protein
VVRQDGLLPPVSGGYSDTLGESLKQNPQGDTAMLHRWSPVSAAGLVLLSVVALHAEPLDQREALRKEILPVLQRVVQPLFRAPAEGRAWLLEASAEVDGERGRLTLAWDGKGQHALKGSLPGRGAIQAGYCRDRSWLAVPGKDVVFTGNTDGAAGASPLERSRLWSVLKEQVAGALILARTAPLPEGLLLEKTGEASWTAGTHKESWKVTLEGTREAGPIRIRIDAPVEARLAIERLEQVDAGELRSLLSPPEDPGRKESVDDGDLRWMLATAVDMLLEKAFWAIRPEVVAPIVPNSLRVDGRAVLVVRGAPEEMGRQYGEALREGVRSNAHRVLHGIGLLQTLRTGRWFPAALEATWLEQEKYIPKRFVREMDALADAAGIPRQHVRWTNIFPEHFHCSGMALRGAATEGGRLLHGRILDYMTEVGFQAGAVLTVHVPEGHHSWVNVGYAGCIGTVTAMNERGLAMGEMGGRGEGHTDGIPMTFLMREVMERFETTEEALDWIRSVPRTCEYFYVLSDSRTRGMAGVASWARSLAREKGTSDLLVIRPGESHPLLPHGIEDTVLMSADRRYERLVRRVRGHYGKITPEIAWEILGEGVAMRSALHIALFQPETLDIWVAEASLDGQPAYTQPVVKLNLRTLLEKAPEARTAAAVGASRP